MRKELMDKYILRKEYFGGILADVKKFTVDSIDKVQYEAVEIMNGIKSDHALKIVENRFVYGVISAPISVTIYPSLKCNAKCDFCFVKSIKHRYKTDMTYYQFCDCIEKLSNAGVVDVEIMGGEPFLVPWIIEGIELVNEKGMHCSINTNATVLGFDRIERLSKVENLALRVSIQDEFGALPKNIQDLFKCCEENQIKIDVLTVLQKKNCDELMQLIDFLPKNIIKNMIILYNNPPIGVIPDYSTDEYYLKANKVKEYSQRNNRVNVVIKGPFGHCYQERSDKEFLKFCDGQCLACVSRFEILPNGDVLPCVKYYSDKENCIGNLFKQTVSEIWFSKGAEKFRNKIDDFKTKCICLKCSWNDLCSGCVGFAEGLNIEYDDRCPRRNNNEKE